MTSFVWKFWFFWFLHHFRYLLLILDIIELEFYSRGCYLSTVKDNGRQPLQRVGAPGVWLGARALELAAQSVGKKLSPAVSRVNSPSPRVLTGGRLQRLRPALLARGHAATLHVALLPIFAAVSPAMCTHASNGLFGFFRKPSAHEPQNRTNAARGSFSSPQLQKGLERGSLLRALVGRNVVACWKPRGLDPNFVVNQL